MQKISSNQSATTYDASPKYSDFRENYKNGFKLSLSTQLDITKPILINLPKILDKRGNLSFFEHPRQLPFEIARTYWIYDVPGGETRGSHAFKEQQEFMIALSGSFDVVLHDGKEETKYSLNRSYFGLFIPKMYWRRIENFSTNSLALIVSDKPFNKMDYIWSFEEFKSMRDGK